MCGVLLLGAAKVEAPAWKRARLRLHVLHRRHPSGRSEGGASRSAAGRRVPTNRSASCSPQPLSGYAQAASEPAPTAPCAAPTGSRWASRGVNVAVPRAVAVVRERRGLVVVRHLPAPKFLSGRYGAPEWRCSPGATTTAAQTAATTAPSIASFFFMFLNLNSGHFCTN